MSNEIELMSDDHGFALLGDPQVIERFLSHSGLPSKDLPLQKHLGTSLSAGSGLAQAGALIAENSGRWVKLTEESAKQLKGAQAMRGSTAGTSRAIITEKGKIKSILEFSKTPGSILTNPAMLAGAAGIMAQLAMQQAMEEITDYLAVIDEKVDNILRAQKDSALADMIGVGLVIDEAMTVREHTGRVSEVTWSKVQGASQTIATTQGYALRQLDALAETLEKKSKVSDLAAHSKSAEATVKDWLAVLARCFQLQDGLAILELDRVCDLDASELDAHRVGLGAARQKRHQQIANSSLQLIDRVEAASAIANAGVLLHPKKSRIVVASGNAVADDIFAFHTTLGIEGNHDSLAARRWADAARAKRDGLVDAGTEGLSALSRFGLDKAQGVRTSAAKASGKILKHATWPRETGADAPPAPPEQESPALHTGGA